jgi:hypothetical protein
VKASFFTVTLRVAPASTEAEIVRPVYDKWQSPGIFKGRIGRKCLRASPYLAAPVCIAMTGQKKRATQTKGGKNLQGRA